MRRKGTSEEERKGEESGKTKISVQQWLMDPKLSMDPGFS